MAEKALTPTPLPGYVLIELISRAKSQGLVDRLKAAGLEYQEPKMQGVPNTATVISVARDESNITVGMRVVIDSTKIVKGVGFKWEGKTLHRISRDDVLGGIDDNASTD